MANPLLDLLFINYCNVKTGHRKEDPEVATASFMQLQTLFVVLAMLINVTLFLPFNFPDPLFWGSVLSVALLSFWLRRWYLKAIYKFEFNHRYHKLPKAKKKKNNILGYFLYLSSFLLTLTPIMIIEWIG